MVYSQTTKRLIVRCVLFVSLFISLASNAETLYRFQKEILVDFNPLRPAFAEEIAIFSDMYEGLVWSRDGVTVLPGVASAWQVSEDGMRYSFTLRRDARWSDGTAVTAQDFVFAIKQRLKMTRDNPEVSFPFLRLIKNAERYLAGDAPLSAVEVNAPEPYRLVITIQRPATFFLTDLSFTDWMPLPHRRPLPKDLAEMSGWVYNGPYIPIEYSKVKLELDRNPYYPSFQANNQFSRIVYLDGDLSEWNVFRAVRENKYFVANSFSLDRQYWFASNRPEFIQASETAELVYLDMNFRRPPLNDPDIRRALEMSIERSTLVRDIRHQPGGEMRRFLFDWLPRLENRSSKIESPDYKKRLALAKQIMMEKGYSVTRPLKLRLFVSVTREALAPGLKAMLRQSFFEPVIEILPHEEMYLKRLVPGEFDLAVVSWRLISMAPDSLMELAYCSKAGEGFFNYGKSCDSTYNNIIDEARKQQDVDSRAALFMQAEKRLLDQNLKIPLFQTWSANLCHPQITGFNQNRFRINPSFLLNFQAQTNQQAL